MAVGTGSPPACSLASWRRARAQAWPTWIGRPVEALRWTVGVSWGWMLIRVRGEGLGCVAVRRTANGIGRLRLGCWFGCWFSRGLGGSVGVRRVGAVGAGKGR